MVAAVDQGELVYGLLDGLDVVGLEESDLDSDRLELRAFFRAEAFGELADLRSALDVATREPTIRIVHMRDFRDRDWAKEWRKFTEALALTPEIWVRPSWSRLPEGCRPTLVIELDPGMAFGTGQHATTRLATALLADRLNAESIDSLLDLGCGTGILAIVAARMGVPNVTAIENDPVAAEIARENAAANGASDVRVLTASFVEADLSPCPLVVANLNAGILIDHADRLVALTRAGGHLIVSGIQSGREASVAEALVSEGAHIVEQRTEEGWTAIRLHRA